MVPPERDPSAPGTALPDPVPAPQADPPVTLEALSHYDTALPAAMALRRRLVGSPPPELSWALASLALAAGVGWLYERRRRLQPQVQGVPQPWYGVSGRSPSGVEETFPEDGEIAEPARPVYVSVIGDTPSRREATLVDLHDLNLKVQNQRRNPAAAAELLEQHLVDFRYTSPWVFLELRELYLQLDQREEWVLVRDAFRTRFGQNAPQWNAPSTAAVELATDQQLCGDLLRKWPQREARLFILRWMLGDALSRQKSNGPPQLALGIYRDMLFLDVILDDVMAAAKASPPVLLTPA